MAVKTVTRVERGPSEKLTVLDSWQDSLTNLGSGVTGIKCFKTAG